MSLPISAGDARALRLMAFDVDGVMTDGRLYFGPEGETLKVFNTLDGHGLKKLAATGVTLAIITGRDTPMVARRARDLGIEHVIQGREDKADALADLAATLGFTARETGYAGDDEPDVGALQWAQIAFAPANAHACARDAADHVTAARGGEGAVREICDALIALREAR
ncbi:KdsC family phosphatase [Alloalcanivorax profundimaris]|uniref:KdsC family phosphatase n=1 Tax=Alloalcanivorax profundimaris TaxID=2735259 RepID=UPI000C4BF08B|nr:HAD hydrolase family protein [Alloalcanivorax profundimaris]MAO58531.1 HAD family hydrolase [Alcanivorax sp.]MCQ6262485.1 HAD hydrolase family protein [Alcanivorax sp. MM125-6]QJX02138.1 HAD hydrolase family protein [Alcanivorax sp. IO_7]UWN49017.1 3-deoxy-D-manno-octulosonate 8-phosphate phosphatase KdsC [Alcanivorax sp. ALC70]MAY09752.1 HAD family hydrolase [Alcanivorax sp.]|tara:strand:- start:35317 stop:35820 length:504 start_codon:yes stop_codon:yes gene_type:complete